MKSIKDIKIGIIGSSFWKTITDNLEKNCVKTLKEKGVDENQITLVRVPGSLEIPLVARILARQKKFDALVAFGAIHKGETYHFEQVANECVRGCMNVSWEFELPVIYEVLAVYDIKDAFKRATLKSGNKGVEAALTALEMINVLSKL